MRDGPRRLPLIALGGLGALIALILAGVYIHRENGTSRAGGVLVNQSGSGPGGETTEVFTVSGAWDLLWSYDCWPSLRNQVQNVGPCDFNVTVKQMSDCRVSPMNQGVAQHGMKNQGVVHNHTGGTFYFVVGAGGSWTVTVTGSGQASGVGPWPHCSEG